MSEYEVYLSKYQYTKLSKLNLDHNTPLRLALHVCVAGDDDVCGIFPKSTDDCVELCRLLGSIPAIYDRDLADALRRDGWGVSGRVRQ